MNMEASTKNSLVLHVPVYMYNVDLYSSKHRKWSALQVILSVLKYGFRIDDF